MDSRKIISILSVFIFVASLVGPIPATAQVDSLVVSGTPSKISLELKGVDILDVLKVLAKKSGLNIIAGKNVRGQVTLFLQDVDVWEAFEVILETSELAYEDINGIIKVVTLRDYEALYGQVYEDKRKRELIRLKYIDAKSASDIVLELKTNIGKVIVDDRSNSLILIDIPSSLKEMKKALADMDSPISTKTFELRYSDVEDMAEKITELLTPATGTIKTDTRLDQLIVVDYPEKINQIAAMIKTFDSRPRQVLIESKIVEVTLNDDFAFGVDWSFLDQHSAGEEWQYSSNSFGGLEGFSAGPLQAGSLSTFTFNNTGDAFRGTISALQGMGKTNTLASPRLMVLSGEEANLSVATRRPYISSTIVQGDTTSTTADNIEFVDVGVILNVKPKITDDNKVLLRVKPEVSSSSADFIIRADDGDGGEGAIRAQVPIVVSQEVETMVLVNTGETVVIGGLIQDKESKIIRKVPLLGDLPIFGRIFKNESIDTTKNELVIFLTPTVVEVNGGADTEFWVGENNRMITFEDFGGENFDFSKGYRTSMISDYPKQQRPWWEKQRNEKIKRTQKRKERDDKMHAEEKAADFLASYRAQRRQRFEKPLNREQAQTPKIVYQQPVLKQQPTIPQPTPPAYEVPTPVVVAAAPAIPTSPVRERYIEELEARLSLASKSRLSLEMYRGMESELLLRLSRTGSVLSIGFPKTGKLATPKLRHLVTQLIQSISPLPQFPTDLDGNTGEFRVKLTI